MSRTFHLPFSEDCSIDLPKIGNFFFEISLSTPTEQSIEFRIEIGTDEEDTNSDFTESHNRLRSTTINLLTNDVESFLDPHEHLLYGCDCDSNYGHDEDGEIIHIAYTCRQMKGTFYFLLHRSMLNYICS